VTVHAGLEEVDASAIVRFLLKFQSTAIIHKFFELVGLSPA
jgi:hypothetical protein